MPKIRFLVVGRLQTNCYVLESEGEAVVVDPGDEEERILRFVRQIRAKVRYIVATHGHFDHILAVNGVRRATTAPFLMHEDDLPVLESMQERVKQFMGLHVSPPPRVDNFLKEGDVLKLGGENIRVLHTPGHSPGSISLTGDGFVLTGDALFNQSIGRTDLAGGDMKTLLESIKGKLFQLPNNTLVYPGHGPETTIEDEKLANPFVGQVARPFPTTLTDLNSVLKESLARASSHSKKVYGQNPMTAPEILDLANSRALILAATIKPNGRPHLSPSDLVAVDGILYIGVDTATARYKNLKQNPNVALMLADGSKRQAILEGQARFLDIKGQTAKKILDAEKNKYGWTTETIAEFIPEKIFTYKAK